jgi:hypothetical protein
MNNFSYVYCKISKIPQLKVLHVVRPCEDQGVNWEHKKREKNFFSCYSSFRTFFRSTYSRVSIYKAIVQISSATWPHNIKGRSFPFRPGRQFHLALLILLCLCPRRTALHTPRRYSSTTHNWIRLSRYVAMRKEQPTYPRYI